MWSIYGLLVAALVAPYFIFIQINGGLVSYFRQASAWAERDRAREPIVWPGLIDNPDGVSDAAKAGSLVAAVRDNGAAWMYYTEILLPFFALFVLAASRDGFRPEWPHARAKLAMVAVLGAGARCRVPAQPARGAAGRSLGAARHPHRVAAGGGAAHAAERRVAAAVALARTDGRCESCGRGGRRSDRAAARSCS